MAEAGGRKYFVVMLSEMEHSAWICAEGMKGGGA